MGESVPKRSPFGGLLFLYIGLAPDRLRLRIPVSGGNVSSPGRTGIQHLPESDVQRVTNASAAGLLKPFSCAINLQKTAAVRTYTAMMMTTTEPTVYSVARTSWLCLVAWPSCRPLGLAASWRYIGRAGLRRASEEDYHSFRRPSHFTISIGPESGSGLVVGPTLNEGAWSARAMTACGTRPTFNG